MVYLPTLSFGFVYDDHWMLLANGFLRSPEDIGLLFDPEGRARSIPDVFRPTSVLFDMLSVHTLGLEAWAHHALSVLLHLGVCVAAHRWLVLLGAPRPVALGTVAIFGILAIHAEAITVVTFREDLLAAGFGLSALIAAEHACRTRARSAWTRIGPLLLAALCMSAACGAKLSAAPLVVLWWGLGLLDPWGHRRARGWSRIATVVLVLAALVVLAHRAHLFEGITPYTSDGGRVYSNRVGLAPVLAASVQIHLGYLQQIVFPWGLSPEYVDYAGSWSDSATLVSAAALLSLLGYALACAWGRRRPVVAFAILGTAILALPTANLVGMPNMRADRFMYLPTLPACVGLAALADRWGRALVARTQSAWFRIAPLLAFVVLQGAFAQGASAQYRSDTRLWEIALRRSPHSARAHAVFGELLVRRAERSAETAEATRLASRARVHCELAVRLDRQAMLPHMCRARLAIARQQWDRAYGSLQAALDRAGTRRDRPLLGMASVALDLSELDWESRKKRALSHLQDVLDEYPYAPEAWATAGRIHHRLGNPEQAASAYRRARKLRPDRWDVVLWGVELALDLGHPSAARTTWAEAEKLLRNADPTARSAVLQRMHRARELFRPRPFSSTSSPTKPLGVP